jgi:hypothetical protein
MSIEMMNEFTRVLLSRLNVPNLGDAKRRIGQLGEDEKIDLLEQLIEATINYHHHPDDLQKS